MMTIWKAWLPIHIILLCASVIDSKKLFHKDTADVNADWIQSSPENFKPDDEFKWDFVDLSTSLPAEASTENSNHQKHSSTKPHITTIPNRFTLADPGLSLVWNAPPYLEDYPAVDRAPVGRSLQAVSPQQPKRKQGTRYEAKTKISLSEYESHEDQSTEQPSENDYDAEYNDSVEEDIEFTTPPIVQTTSTASSASKLISVTTAPTLSKKAVIKTSTSSKRTTAATTLRTVVPVTKILNRIPIIRKPVAIIRDQTKYIRQQAESTTEKSSTKMRARGRAAKPQTLSTRKPAVQQQTLRYAAEEPNKNIVHELSSEADDIDWENTPLKVPQEDFGMRLSK